MSNLQSGIAIADGFRAPRASPPVDLERTFTEFSATGRQEDDWFASPREPRGRLTWTRLHSNRLSIVLGEAGIGKTIEFKLEATRLKNRGESAFLIELNQLHQASDWELCLIQVADLYKKWAASDTAGYFFLDAVDEARLTDHASFKKALSISLNGLQPYLNRVRICLSSRITDWFDNEVQLTVAQTLFEPIMRARAQSEREEPDVAPEFSNENREADSANPDVGSAIDGPEQPFVVSLNPLSAEAAKQLATALGVRDLPRFWEAVDDGSYAYMATRPLDLSWMVSLWNQTGTLGSYSELLENNVRNRLTEKNPSYQTAAVNVSLEKMRTGAEELAAAAVFSGRAFVALPDAEGLREMEFRPGEVLWGWTPVEITRLLASAVFDEATYGRVKFHHRSTRDYLAACWVNRQLQDAVPLPKIIELFAVTPYDQTVLIPSRRWTLCWLVAMHAGVREWVVHNFPEMLAFDGDPEAWDALSVDQAFTGYVSKLAAGLSTDWYNDESEFRRVGRRLPAGRIAALLRNTDTPGRVRHRVLPYVKYALLTDCADIVFNAFVSTTNSTDDRVEALNVLEAIATPEQRIFVREQLLSGRLEGNELIAGALTVVGWEDFTGEQLQQVFERTVAEEGFGHGYFARTIKHEVLPGASMDILRRLLGAVTAVMPVPDGDNHLSKYSNSEEIPRAWALEVLSEIFESLLKQIPVSSQEYPEICFVAALALESLRDTGYFDSEEEERVAALILQHTSFRWQLALRIAQSPHISHGADRLRWPKECIVTFSAGDVPDLVLRATSNAEPPVARQLWFELALNMATMDLPGTDRRKFVADLLNGPDAEARATAVRLRYAGLGEMIRQRRERLVRDRERKGARLQKESAFHASILAKIDRIAAGTDEMTIFALLQQATLRPTSLASRMDRSIALKKFGADVAAALDSGLAAVWNSAEIPNPADLSTGHFPRLATLLLSALDVMLNNPNAIEDLGKAGAARAARVACWESDHSPAWFKSLYASYPAACVESLTPWIVQDAQDAGEFPPLRGALDLAFRSDTDTRRALLRPLIPLVAAGEISNQRRLRRLLKVLYEDAMIDTTVASGVCAEQLAGDIDAKEFTARSAWMSIWLSIDPRSAWAWFEQRVLHPELLKSSLTTLIRSCGDLEWARGATSNDVVNVLVGIFGLLALRQDAPSPEEAPDSENHWVGRRTSVGSVKDAIPRFLSEMLTAAADRALVQLLTIEIDPDRQRWIQEKRMDIARATAEKKAVRPTGSLRDWFAPFTANADSERDVYLQGLACLDAIRLGIEQGPFSERDLFKAGMPEKHLQLWLASRLWAINPRAFSVHREEVVDDDKMTDIQLSTKKGSVCIEIKPLDTSRSYSASSLIGTLKDQIVGQYLKGYNSKHGILVLLRLDRKRWTLPGQPGVHSFGSLIDFLQRQADLIRAESDGVEELKVVGIDCMTRAESAAL